ncbi:hypothetical protein [Burkholderia pseudomallei]|uniref:hypothetical protein n=1 Tax=Burkholderia pseudomallei TaxID=28450 RepID=UPI000F20E0EC|nr:hypothetical protein [Burkholderia pseudomallei]CAJ3073298.1 Uncharacterised protein [Burkholderia pseudomallei]VCK72812.1 Uncharacterised protein [Burkholderia pseudomallei]VCK79996.1 Uncharacterised protein [Burkholderia pseudomallei]VCK80018.1 Uncharacterised protein [Burkholderia pseudomallei]VCK80769.1 Uncharacterised protein [Burkholderia pseudomallei]
MNTPTPPLDALIDLEALGLSDPAPDESDPPALANETAARPRATKSHRSGWMPMEQLRKMAAKLQLGFPLKALGEEAALNLLISARQCNDTPNRHLINVTRERFKSTTTSDGAKEQFYDALSQNLGSILPALHELQAATAESRALTASFAHALESGLDGYIQAIAKQHQTLSDDLRKQNKRDLAEQSTQFDKLAILNGRVIEKTVEVIDQQKAIIQELNQHTAETARLADENEQLRAEIAQLRSATSEGYRRHTHSLSRFDEELNARLDRIEMALARREAGQGVKPRATFTPSTAERDRPSTGNV